MAKKIKPQVDNYLSNEIVSDSDSENGETPKTTSQSKPSNLSQSKVVKTPTKLSVRPAVVAKPAVTAVDGDDETTSSADSESSDQQSDSENSLASHRSSSQTSRKRATPDAKHTQAKVKKARIAPPSTTRIAPRPFTAPQGYDAVTFRSSDAGIQFPISGKAREDVQIWHITAPASVKIEDLTSFDIQAALRGDEILNQNGLGYALQKESNPRPAILLPDSATGGYRPSKTEISHSFFLRETRPRSANGIETSSRTDQTNHDLTFTAVQDGTKRKPREQPSGLRMRYVPYGVVSDMPKDVQMADVDTEDLTVALSSPLQDDNRVEIADTPKKKKKKSNSQQTVDEQFTSSPPKSQIKDKKKKRLEK